MNALPRRIARVATALAATAAVAAPPAHAAFPGSPGKVAYVDTFQPLLPLKVFTPGPGPDGGTVELVRADTLRSVAGGGELATIGLVTAPVWSPDGTRLAFAARVPDPGLAPGASHLAIFTWNLRTKATTQITFPPPGAPSPPGVQGGHSTTDYGPAWSPDGTRIAFVRHLTAGSEDSHHATRGGDIFTVPAAGGAVTRVTGPSLVDVYTGLAWGGDPDDPLGGALVGLRARTEVDLRLMRIDPLTGSETTLVGGFDAAAMQDYDVMPSGRAVVYSKVGGGASASQIRRLDLDTLVDTAVADVTDSRVRASPTGNGALRIAFAPVLGTSGQSRFGLLERRFADPDGDVWAEDAKDRFVSRYTGPTGANGIAVPFRSAWDVQPQRLPIIVIPGFAGSTLKCEESVSWPPGPLPSQNGTALMGLRLADDGVSPAGCLGAGPTADPDAPDGLVSTAFGQPIYKPMEDMVEALAPGDRSWRFSWDWRKAPSQSIARLDAFITRVLDTDFARDQGATQVVVYAHSYGSLLTREYIVDRPHRIARVLTAGAPYWGSPKPVFPLTFGVENPLAGVIDLDTFLPDDAVKAVFRNMAGAYHLLPSDRLDPWLTVAGQDQDAAGVRAFLTGIAGGTGPLADQARAWHRTHDGFATAGGTIDWRAVISTGVLTVNGLDTAAAPAADGTLDAILRLGDGDGTVPARSASQGAVGTHTPLGDPVHVQSICHVTHVPLPGDPAVGDAYGEFLLTGRTPRKLPPACRPSGVSVKVMKADTTPSAAAAPGGVSADAAVPSLDEAARDGAIQLYELPSGAVAVIDDHRPVAVRLAGPGEAVRIEVRRHDGDAVTATLAFTPPSGEVVLTTGPGGVAVTSDGAPVPPAAGDATPPPPAPAPTVPAGPASPVPGPAAPGAGGPAAVPAPQSPAGRRTCRGPRLVGATPAAARRALVRAGCRLGRVSGARAGSAVVVRQSPAAGRVVPRGTAVRVVVGGRR